MDYMKQQVQKAKEDSSNKGVFVLKIFGVLCGSGNSIVTKQTIYMYIFLFKYILISTALSTICFLALAALPIAMIVIGRFAIFNVLLKDYLYTTLRSQHTLMVTLSNSVLHVPLIVTLITLVEGLYSH